MCWCCHSSLFVASVTDGQFFSLQGKCYKIHVVEENAIFVFMNGLLTSIFVQVTKRASEH